MLHLSRRINANGRDMFARIVVINNHAELFIKHCYKTTGTNMTILGNFNYKLVKHRMELFGIVTHLNEATVCKIHSRVFSPYSFILASGRIVLNE